MVVFTTKRGYCTARFYSDYAQAEYNINRLLRDGFAVAQLYYFSESQFVFEYYATYIIREDWVTGKEELVTFEAKVV